MSLVGPRPPFHDEMGEDCVRQSLRLTFPPGMTGLWQVCGRSDVDYDGMIRMDLEYTRTWSFWLDLKILLQTLPAVVMGKGAC
jgi:lipopolysaccharide/colanic/teichoic acid biosynthesis glycosyltransferase